MATRNADVNLIVRARTEGEKAIAGLSGILNDLFDDARGGSADIADLGKTLGALDKAASAIAGSMSKAGSAIDRQRASLSENNAAYASLLKQQAEAQRVLSSFGDQSNKDFVGPRTKAFVEGYAGVRAEVDRLGGAISTLFNKINQQNTQFSGTQSALLNLSATSTAVAQGQAQAEAQIELTNQALREQAAAAERVTEIQQRINALTGVDRPRAAAPDLDLLAAADAEYRRKEAAEAEAIALRQVNNQLAERARLEATLERTTGLGRISARDAGASFSALDARERDAEQRDREAKAERDLAEATRVTNNQLAERARLEATLERTTGIGRNRAVDSGATISALTELVNKEHAAAEASELMDKEVAQLRATLDPLAAIQDRFNASLARYRLLAKEGKLGADELAAAERHLAEEADRARLALSEAGGPGAAGGKNKIGLFGLKPYELQNLSYQVNDVVTQLASGTSLTQTLSQQGGQILQLFPRVAGSLIGALRDPRILLLVGTVIAIAAAFKEAANQAERLREYSGQTTFRADGGTYNPKALADAEDGLERIGAKAKDAEAAVKVFLNEGINPDLLAQFGRVAQETAEVLGTDLPTAAKQVADAFTGGFKAVADLDDKLNFLSASEREHIRDLFESGSAEAARTEALNIYSRQMSAAAGLMRGPWADASRSLGTAWDSLIKYIADSLPIRATIVVLDELAGVVKDVGDAITGAFADDTPKAGSTVANIAAVQAQVAKLKKEIADYELAIEKKSPISGTLQRLVEQSKRQLAEAQAELTKLEKNAPDTLNSDPNSSAAKRRAERLADIDGEREIQRLRQKGQSGLNAVDSARRVQQAGEIAYRQEMEATGDAIVAARLREIAITKEQGDVDKANEAARKAARAEREREIRQFQIRVVGAEGGTAKNPFSTAKGYGQFTEGTFINQFQKVFPERAASLPRDQILALRQNEQVARAIIDNYSRENAKFLESFGAKVTAGNLYLAHFLGAGGAKAVLTAPGDKPVDQILQRLPSGGKVLSGNQGYLRTNGGKGRYRTANELESFIANRVGDTGAAQTQGQVEINNLIEDSRRKQDAFNLSIRQGNENRQAAIGSLRSEVGLFGEALIAEQRRQAVAEAELDIRQQVEDANKNLKPGETAVVVTQDQIDKAKELAGALFDVQNARAGLTARLDEAQRPVDILEDQRDLLIQQRDLLQSVGDFEAAGQVQAEIDSLAGSIDVAYQKLIEFYRALTPDERVSLGILDDRQLDNIIGKLELARDRCQEWGTVAGVSGEQIAQSFSSGLVNSVTNFINRVAAGKNVFRSLSDGIREFAATFIGSIAQMILQLLAYAAAVSILRALGVPVPVSGLGVGQHHTGGIAGGSAGGVRRTAAPEMFAAAMRYHTGGIAGFAPDEVPAVLKRNEEVLTEGDPRHRFNGGLEAGREGGQPMSVKNVNLFDLDSLAQAMMSTKAGEKVILNIIKANGRAVKAALS